MSQVATRQVLKVTGRISTTVLDSKHNSFQKLSHSSAEFIKCPVNIGDCLKKRSNDRSWKDLKLYVKYLDMKAQNPNCGSFKIYTSPRYYQRTIKALIEKGWAFRRDDNTVCLKAYQFVWRDMGVSRLKDQKNRIERFKYWKIPIEILSHERKNYLKEIEHEIRKRISKRKLAQIRFALKDQDDTRARFSARSAGSLFGYRSAGSGSKLREKYFEVIEPEKVRWKWNKKRGRYEEETKQIAL